MYCPPRYLSGMRTSTRSNAQPLSDLRSSNLRSVQLLAQDLLGRAVDDRIATTVEYQRMLGVGSGTVQKALSFLESTGAVTLSRHGHLGTRIIAQDDGLLWGVAGRGQVRLVLHPPGPIDGFGMLKGLHDEFDRLGVPLDVRYLQGAEARAALVADGTVDLSVLSSGAAKSLRPGLRQRLRTVELGTGIYYAPGSLAVVRRAGRRKQQRSGPTRVAIDRSSHDHVRLTEAEFPPAPPYEFVDCPYPQVLTELLQRHIDAAVWHQTLLPVPLDAMGLRADPLDTDLVAPILESVSAAALVLRTNDSALARMLPRLDVSVVVDAQAELLAMDPASPELHTKVWLR